jgi:hypothetical protein
MNDTEPAANYHYSIQQEGASMGFINLPGYIACVTADWKCLRAVPVVDRRLWFWYCCSQAAWDRLQAAPASAQGSAIKGNDQPATGRVLDQPNAVYQPKFVYSWLLQRLHGNPSALMCNKNRVDFLGIKSGP